MTTVTMDMSSFAIEGANLAAVEYGDEVLNAGWNPALSQQQRDAVDHSAMPRSLANADVDAFLKRMYANQR